jgi:hypothetical protein
MAHEKISACTRVHIFRTLELEDKAITCMLHHTFIILNALLVHLAAQKSLRFANLVKTSLFHADSLVQLVDGHFCCPQFDSCDYSLNKVQGL